MVEAAPLRIAFFGTPSFAVPTLDALLASPHHVVGVVTQPDRPRGRGHKVVDAPVKARAIEARVPMLQPATLKDPAFVAAFAGWRPDLAVVAAYGRILPEPLIALPRLGMVNVHASLLPKYRGAAPVHRAVMNGDAETGVTIMRVVKALDAGPMLASIREPIGPNQTSVEVEAALARSGAALLVDSVDRIARGEAVEVPQEDSAATYAPRITREEGIIDWKLPATSVHNLIRGLHPWPHASTYAEGQRIILRRSVIVGDDRHDADDPGEVLLASGDDLIVATGQGSIRLVELHVEESAL